jgi:hypothetical protein
MHAVKFPFQPCQAFRVLTAWSRVLSEQLTRLTNRYVGRTFLTLRFRRLAPLPSLGMEINLLVPLDEAHLYFRK